AADLYEQPLRNEPIDCGCRAALAATLHNIARILADTGRPAEALEPYRKAFEHREAIVRQSPENVKWQGDCGFPGPAGRVALGAHLQRRDARLCRESRGCPARLRATHHAPACRGPLTRQDR